MQKKTPTIGYLMFNFDAGYQLAVWQGVDDAIREHGANIISYVGGHLDAPESKQRNIVYDLVDTANLDGLIVMSSTLGSRVTLERLQQFLHSYGSLPMVSIGLGVPGLHNVLVENQTGLRQAIRHLIEAHGRRRIAFIRGPVGYEEADLRYQAYAETLAEYDIPLDPDLVLPGSFQPEDGTAAVGLLLDQRRVTFDAIAAANDFMALGAMEALQKRGVKIPQEVAIVGFDDVVDARSVMPPMTTVRQPLHEQGRQAVEMMMALIAGESPAKEVILPTELVTRQSCGCFSEMALQAMTPPTVTGGATVGDGTAVTTTLRQQRQEIITHLQDNDTLHYAGRDAGWAAELYDNFLADLTDDTTSQKGAFLSALEKFLNESAKTGDSVIEWQNVISQLRRLTLPLLGTGELLTRAENIWGQARIVIGEVAERVQYTQRHETAGQARRLNQIGSQLITTFDLSALADILAAELPQLDVRSCYLALYEDPAFPTTLSRMIMAYDEHGRVSLDAHDPLFPTRQLVLPGMLPTDRTYSMMVQPLFFQEEQLGFVLFETNNRKGLIYETLQVQISSSLKGALLVEKEAKRAHQLRNVAEISTATSTILDKTELLQHVVDLTKERFGFYHAHIYLLDADGQALSLAAGAGQIGRQMVADGWRIPLIREQSLIAEAARGGDIVIVGNVRQAKSWLSNPLLPDTYAEMAVPLIAKGKVIGVLDVQSDKVGGLEESDANLLRSLANHVAVSLTNAILFTQTVQTKEEAEQAKELAERSRREAETAREEAETARQMMEVQVWQTTGQAELNNQIRGEQDIPTLANNIVRQLCNYLGAHIGALYIANADDLELAGSYAYSLAEGHGRFRFGEGLVGQAAAEKTPKIITAVPDNYITVRSGLGQMAPRHIMVVPFTYEEHVVGVLEIGTLTQFEEAQLTFLNTAMSNVGIAFNTAQARARINELLAQTQRQAEELQAQGEELRVANEELEAQTESLRASETKLKEKQQELEATNVQLEEKAAALEESSLALYEKQVALDKQNRDLKTAQQELERKAEELALASKYKSEFLANMSHELRTPLNSLLILAGLLAENKDGNLNEEQVESAKIIYSGGHDLLNLINDILDLSKVESGKMIFNFEPLPVADLVSQVRTQFGHVAEEKGLALNIHVADDAPTSIETDRMRVLQIIKNLLSNAFKFTSQGSVDLEIARPGSQVSLLRSGLDPAQAVAIVVRDTGIGMTPEQLKIVFEAFQQADGSTSRQYGGTGLGLSISRELAAKLGGQIDVVSERGQGSTFTLYLPIGTTRQENVADVVVTAVTTPLPPLTAVPDAPPAPTPAPPTPFLPDDRATLQTGDKHLLLIEDDPRFAKIVYNFAGENGFKCLLAGDGATGLALVREYQPQAVILDLNLPDMSGWQVLDVLKNDPATRHIPVHIMSVEEEVLDAYHKGAMGYLTKPINQESLAGVFSKIEKFIAKEIKSLLLVEDDPLSRRSIVKLLGGSDVQISEAEHGQMALDLMKTQRFDCIILDLSLPDMTGFELLNQMNGASANTQCPIIVYTGRDLTPEENHQLMKYADSIIVKGVKSPERLLDETALFLHRVVSDMPAEKQQTIKHLHDHETILKGKRILIVDDDMRNSFALSKLLSDKGIVVRIAANGQKALDLLEQEPIDLVLMDIMMPVMDGYETTRHIRRLPQYGSLPILALTAKAMKGDREKCLEAGANDYLPKPIDVDRLFSMLRVWL